VKNGKLSKAKAKAACYYCCSCYLANARQTKLEQKLNLPSVFFFLFCVFGLSQKVGTGRKENQREKGAK